MMADGKDPFDSVLPNKTFKYLLLEDLCDLHKNVDYRRNVQSKDSLYNVKKGCRSILRFY